MSTANPLQVSRSALRLDHVQKQTRIESHLRKLLSIWRELYDEEVLTDGEILIGEEDEHDEEEEEQTDGGDTKMTDLTDERLPVPVHRAVLMSVSDYFRNAFANVIDADHPCRAITLIFPRHVVSAIVGLCYEDEMTEEVSPRDYPALCHTAEYVLADDLSAALEAAVVPRLAGVRADDLVPFFREISFPAAQERAQYFIPYPDLA